MIEAGGGERAIHVAGGVGAGYRRYGAGGEIEFADGAVAGIGDIDHVLAGHPGEAGVLEEGGARGGAVGVALAAAGDGGHVGGSEVDFADGAVFAVGDVGDLAIGDDALGLAELGGGGASVAGAGANAIAIAAV